MGKRQTDSSKWKKPFIRALKAPYKLLWLYICDNCDHAGIWQVDFVVAPLEIGEKINKETAIEVFGDKVIVFDEGEKWFIPSFIDFQYGPLNIHNRVHISVIHLLRKYNLIDENLRPLLIVDKALISPLQGEKDKDKDKDMNLGIEGGVGETAPSPPREPINPSFEKFQGWIADNAPNVSRLKEPFTQAQFIRLFEEYDGPKNKKLILEVLYAMHNKKSLVTEYVSANLTLRNWLERRIQDPKNNHSETSPQLLHPSLRPL